MGYLASGNQEEAAKILKEHPELLVHSGSVIDPSGRHFKKIKPFELVLWTMDVRYMANMVLDCIPKDEKGKEIRIELLKQYKAVIEDFDAEKKTGGVHYTLNGEKHHEKHFDFQPLINALDTYVKNHDGWNKRERKIHWCQAVGKKQGMLPMHVRHHYCDPDESFDPTPTFDKKELKRNLKFYNHVKNEELVWDSGLVGLGINFGISRADSESECGTESGRGAVEIDLAAVISLCKMRMGELELLKKQLVQSIQKTDELQESYQQIIL